MFLDSFPMQMRMPENRVARPLREPTVVDTGKSRSVWPFIVSDKGFAVPTPPQAPSSFVT